jgi:predicted Fe-Mo cluster-binding NifX family protein
VTTVTNALKARGIEVLTARPVPATLEDVFIALITAESSSGESSHSERPS